MWSGQKEARFLIDQQRRGDIMEMQSMRNVALISSLRTIAGVREQRTCLASWQGRRRRLQPGQSGAIGGDWVSATALLVRERWMPHISER